MYCGVHEKKEINYSKSMSINEKKISLNFFLYNCIYEENCIKLESEDI